MMVHILYKKDSPQEREAAGYVRRLDELQVAHELVEADSSRGISLVELYDLPATPALVLATDDGSMIERWQGEWPSVEDVSYRFHAGS